MIKIICYYSDGINRIYTLEPKYYALLTDIAALNKVEVGSETYDALLEVFAAEGLVVSVRDTPKSKAEIDEEMRRNYPDAEFLKEGGTNG